MSVALLRASCTAAHGARVRFMIAAVMSPTPLHEKIHESSITAALCAMLSLLTPCQVWHNRLIRLRMCVGCQASITTFAKWNITHDSLLPLPFSLWLIPKWHSEVGSKIASWTQIGAIRVQWNIFFPFWPVYWETILYGVIWKKTSHITVQTQC